MMIIKWGNLSCFSAENFGYSYSTLHYVLSFDVGVAKILQLFSNIKIKICMDLWRVIFIIELLNH